MGAFLTAANAMSDQMLKQMHHGMGMGEKMVEVNGNLVPFAKLDKVRECIKEEQDRYQKESEKYNTAASVAATQKALGAMAATTAFCTLANKGKESGGCLMLGAGVGAIMAMDHFKSMPAPTNYEHCFPGGPEKR